MYLIENKGSKFLFGYIKDVKIELFLYQSHYKRNKWLFTAGRVFAILKIKEIYTFIINLNRLYDCISPRIEVPQSKHEIFLLKISFSFLLKLVQFLITAISRN